MEGEREQSENAPQRTRNSQDRTVEDPLRERYGPLLIERYIKEDERALILYKHAEDEQ